MIIVDVSGTFGARIKALAAMMLNVELGATVFAPDLGRLPETERAPTLVLEIPARVEGRPPVDMTCTPSVGVVYCSREGRRPVSEIVNGVAPLLEKESAHLGRALAVGASPNTLVEGGPGPRACQYVQGPLKMTHFHDQEMLWVRRRIIYMDSGVYVAPPNTSWRAGFTWVFMGIGAPLAFSGGGVSSNSVFNALVAGLVFDEATLTRFKPGPPVFEVRSQDFVRPPATAWAQELQSEIRSECKRGALVLRVGQDGTVLGLSADRPPSGRPPPRVEGEEAWGSKPLYQAALQQSSPRCLVCDAYLHGQAYVLRDVGFPSATVVHTRLCLRFLSTELSGQDSVLGEFGVGVCRECYTIVPECFGGHSRGTWWHTRLSLSQQEAYTAAGRPRLGEVMGRKGLLGRDIKGQYLVIPDTVVLIPAPKRAGGADIGPNAAILAALGRPKILDLKLPVVEILSISVAT